MTAATLERETDADESVLDIEALTGAPWFPHLVDPAFFDFIKAEGRVPRLGDSRPAYPYRGWMLFQVWMLSGARGIHSGWTHYFETLAAGRLPDRPVPPLNFRPAEDAKGRILKALGKMVERLGRGYGERALNLLIEWVAFALACDSDPEPDIPASTSRWLYEQFDVSQLLSHPHDYLGDMLEQHRGKSKRFQGFFLTGERVCELMTELAAADYDGDLRMALVYEPAAGSSRQLLQFSGLSHRLAGQDIDPVCVKISRINGALYAPHLTFPVPEALLSASLPPTEPSASAADLREGQRCPRPKPPQSRRKHRAASSLQSTGSLHSSTCFRGGTMSRALIDPASGAGGFMQGRGVASLSRILDAVSPYAGGEAARVAMPPCGLLSRAALLTLEERAGRFDLIITNPPFSGNTADAKAEGSTLKTSKSELLFLEHIISSLRPGGRGCVLVPGGVLFGSGKAHVEVRRRLIEENNLQAVVHLPAGAFKPYAGSATSIILFTAGAPATRRVWFDELTALGYTLDNRRPTGRDDVPAVLERWRGRRGHVGGREGTGFFVPVEDLRENDYVLQIGRYREIITDEPAGKSVEELMMDIVRIDVEVTKHMRDLAAMLGMSYDEMMRRAMERPLPPADRAAGEG